MAEEGITEEVLKEFNMSLETKKKLDAVSELVPQNKTEYEVRIANAAIEGFSSKSVDEVKESVAKLENEFGDKKEILSALKSIALFARTTDNPEALLNTIDQHAESFVKETPTEQHDGTWHDVRKARELAVNDIGINNVAHLMWEKTSRRYIDMYGEMPQTQEEKQKFEDAKKRATKLKVS